MAAAIGQIQGARQPVSCVPLTEAELENQIRSVTAEEIFSLSQHIVGQVMSRLNIDVICGVELPGLINKWTDGTEVPAYGDRYDPESRLMKQTFPHVQKLLEEAFSTPAEFLAKGLYIPFFTADQKGLLDQIDDEFLLPRLNRAKEKLIRGWELNSLSLGQHLQLNLGYTQESGELSFKLYQKMNGANVGESGGSLKSIQKDQKIYRC